MGKHVRAGDLDIWTEQVGVGPDVLLIGGLGDTVESWQFQLDGLRDRYRLTAFDNRGAGRTRMPDGRVSVEIMACPFSSDRKTSNMFGLMPRTLTPCTARALMRSTDASSGIFFGAVKKWPRMISTHPIVRRARQYFI